MPALLANLFFFKNTSLGSFPFHSCCSPCDYYWFTYVHHCLGSEFVDILLQVMINYIIRYGSTANFERDQLNHPGSRNKHDFLIIIYYTRFVFMPPIHAAWSSTVAVRTRRSIYWSLKVCGCSKMDWIPIIWRGLLFTVQAKLALT